MLLSVKYCSFLAIFQKSIQLKDDTGVAGTDNVSVLTKVSSNFCVTDLCFKVKTFNGDLEEGFDICSEFNLILEDADLNIYIFNP